MSGPNYPKIINIPGLGAFRAPEGVEVETMFGDWLVHLNGVFLWNFGHRRHSERDARRLADNIRKALAA